MAMLSGRDRKTADSISSKFGGHLFVNMGAFFCLILLMAGGAARNDAMADLRGAPKTPKVVGGPCEYRVYKGHATILSIQKQAGRQAGSCGSAYECYHVRFSFQPGEKIEESFAQVGGKVFSLLLRNGWYPGPKFLHKYAIEAGKVFDCDLNVITRGTCTPVIFDFPAIDLSDYKADSQ